MKAPEHEHDYEQEEEQEQIKGHSYDDFQPVPCDLDSRLLHMRAFPGAGHKNRVCIVYVGVNLPARWRLSQEIETAVADG